MRARRRWETRTGAAEAQPAGVDSPANCLFSAKNSAAVFCDSRLFFAAPPPPPPSPASLFGGIPRDKGARIHGLCSLSTSPSVLRFPLKMNVAGDLASRTKWSATNSEPSRLQRMPRHAALLALLAVLAAAESPHHCDHEASGLRVCCALIRR